MIPTDNFYCDLVLISIVQCVALNQHENKTVVLLTYTLVHFHVSHVSTLVISVVQTNEGWRVWFEINFLLIDP